MKQLLSILLLVCLIIPASAESPSSVVDYVKGLGFEISDTWEGPGWRTCYLLEDSYTQTLTFSDAENAYAIVSGPLIAVPYNESDLRNLFVDLVSNFDWDISFFGPDNDTRDKFVLSFGIEKDLDKTEQNYSDKSEYLNALKSWLDADKEAAWQALSDKIDSWNVPEIEPSSITECITHINGTHPLSTRAMDGATSACAQYIIFPEYIFAGPGGQDPILAKFLHPELGVWSYEEQWGVYGNIVQYVRSHASELISDGHELSSGSVTSVVSVSIYTEACQYISFFDLASGEITTTILDN